MLDKILSLVNGKKSTIIAICALAVTLALKESFINDNWAVFLNGVLVVLAGGANYINYKKEQ